MDVFTPASESGSESLHGLRQTKSRMEQPIWSQIGFIDFLAILPIRNTKICWQSSNRYV